MIRALLKISPILCGIALFCMPSASHGALYSRVADGILADQATVIVEARALGVDARLGELVRLTFPVGKLLQARTAPRGP